MVKHTQTIRRQFAEELFELVWPFRGIGASYSMHERVKGLMDGTVQSTLNQKSKTNKSIFRYW